MDPKVLNRFDTATHRLLEKLTLLSEVQLNSLPFAGSWTAGQLGNHLYKSYNIMDTLYGNVEDSHRDPSEKLREIEKLFKDSTVKMKSPPEIEPATDYIDKTQLLNSLRERISLQREAIKTMDLSKTCLNFAIPGYGAFTRLEWIGFNTIHTERHNEQLEKIIACL